MSGPRARGRMYATAAARSDGLLLLCGGRDAEGVPLGDAYGLARHRDGRWEWAAAPGALLLLLLRQVQAVLPETAPGECCSGQCCSLAPRADAWCAQAGVMPTARYQHGAVFVNARLHISGGAVGGGRMVDDAAPVVVLDTAAGVWCTQAPATGPSDNGAESHEWARRCAARLHPHWLCTYCSSSLSASVGIMHRRGCV